MTKANQTATLTTAQTSGTGRKEAAVFHLFFSGRPDGQLYEVCAGYLASAARKRFEHFEIASKRFFVSTSVRIERVSGIGPGHSPRKHIGVTIGSTGIHRRCSLADGHFNEFLKQIKTLTGARALRRSILETGSYDVFTQTPHFWSA